MSKDFDVIILAAGQSLLLDGFNKLLIKHPKTRKTILDNYLEQFEGYNVKIVVGYKALDIMNEYPNQNYIYNSEWATTNNSGSLAKALDDKACYIISNDFFIEPELIKSILTNDNNLAVCSDREARGRTSINCTVDEDSISNVYSGQIKNNNDLELIGIFKVTDISSIRELKDNCKKYPHRFIAENLPCQNSNFKVLLADQSQFTEVNSTADYLRLIQKGGIE